jgi:hypothetical protein
VVAASNIHQCSPFSDSFMPNYFSVWHMLLKTNPIGFFTLHGKGLAIIKLSAPTPKVIYHIVTVIQAP